MHLHDDGDMVHARDQSFWHGFWTGIVVLVLIVTVLCLPLYSNGNVH